MPRNRRNDGPIDFDALLDPARAFAHPVDVVSDPDLTLTEKRALLAAWARRACAAEAVPTLSQPADATPVGADDALPTQAVAAVRLAERQLPHSHPLHPAT